ncbi:MAG: tetratricopeptide repeat protein [bacterium]
MRIIVLFAILIAISLVGICAGVAKPTVPVAVQLTKATVTALADRYISAREAKLSGVNKTTVDSFKFHLNSLKNNPVFLVKLVNETINALTLSLANMKSLDALTVSSAYLVKAQPENPRAINLLASILHSAKKYDDAAALLEYSRGIDKESMLIMLNLANVYLDLDKTDKAKPLLDAVMKKEPTNRDGYLSLALYWYKKNDKMKAKEMLDKAGQVVGMVRKASKKHEEDIRKEDVNEADGLPVMETKIDKLKNQVPLTTADAIEDDFPMVAQKIREKYGKLLDSEKMKMPKLPQGKTNSNKDYEDNKPIFTEWINVFVDRQKDFLVKEKFKGMIPGSDDDAAVEAKGKEVAREKLRAALDMAKKQLAMVKNMPGVNKSDIKTAEIEIAKLEKEYKFESTTKPGAEQPISDVPAGWDSGGLYSRANYSDYLIISRSYESYIRKFFADYNAKEKDIIDVFSKKEKELKDAHNAQLDKMQQQHDAASGKNSAHNDKDEPCVRERIRCIREMNTLRNEYYKQWVNLYMPQYAQKMKPMLEDYWYVEALYLRNMNDPKVIEREYLRVKDNYMNYAMEAAKHIMIGVAFPYDAATEEEEKELEALLAKAEEEAPWERKKFEGECATPDGDWMKWIEDHLSFEVSAEFLTFKITARTIELNAWVFGPGAGIKVDMVDETMETYTGVGAKFEVGVKVAGVGVKAEGKGDFARKWTKWDFQNGTYKEGYGAKAEGNLGIGAVSLSGEAEIDTQLNAKGSASLNGTLAGGITSKELGSFGGGD